jgi:hypothetical protein
MIRSRLVQAWYNHFKRREDPMLQRFSSLRIDAPKAAVPVFYARKSA